jgi:hypothetical protein
MSRKWPWEKTDVSFLRRNAGKHSAPWIAKRLKRTECATRQKAFALRLSLDTRAAAKITENGSIEYVELKHANQS